MLVNNAGIYMFGPLESVTEEVFHGQFDLNVLGLLLTTKEAVKFFGPEGGSIVNVSSVASKVLPPNASIYAATKAAVDAITRSLSKELGPRKIRVKAVNPGVIETEGTHSAGIMGSSFETSVQAQTPLWRTGKTDDVSPTVAYLASSDSKYVTGETVVIAGGFR